MMVFAARTALYDGLKTALEQMEKGRLDKKTLVLIGDGGDNASDTTKAEIIRLVEESLATIYTVGIYNPEDKDKKPGFMKHLAEVSGVGDLPGKAGQFREVRAGVELGGFDFFAEGREDSSPIEPRRQG